MIREYKDSGKIIISVHSCCSNFDDNGVPNVAEKLKKKNQSRGIANFVKKKNKRKFVFFHRKYCGKMAA